MKILASLLFLLENHQCYLLMMMIKSSHLSADLKDIEKFFDRNEHHHFSSPFFSISLGTLRIEGLFGNCYHYSPSSGHTQKYWCHNSHVFATTLLTIWGSIWGMFYLKNLQSSLTTMFENHSKISFQIQIFDKIVIETFWEIFGDFQTSCNSVNFVFFVDSISIIRACLLEFLCFAFEAYSSESI